VAAAVSVRVGFRPSRQLFADRERLAAVVAQAEAGGLDRLVVGDHVGFRGGFGFDGLIHATVLAALSTRITVATAVYLLPLRHPVTVARQVSSLAELAPGRIELGVGVGGEDPAEYRMCEVDPTTRGARANESLAIVRTLLAGEPVTVSGEHFVLDGVRVLPRPPVPVPLLVGGRSHAALRRTALHGDGWIALWVTPSRFAAGVAEIDEIAAAHGRAAPDWRHTMHLWCGIGDDRAEATRLLAEEMEALYGVPFDRFARYCPAGRPEDVAEAVEPFVAAGCRDINLITVARDAEAALEGTLAVRDLLGSPAVVTSGGG
jgi:alkanesulfonate monooxygenase SsuD/methylene tetrahydromethanopterin reductase-like flavin-dependent oxidoreductase (luciferase family)